MTHGLPPALDLPAISVELGDITRVTADGLITAVNSRGMWAGAHNQDGVVTYRWVTENPCSVDGSIQCVAGGQFHLQAQVLRDRPEGETVVARTQRPHQGAFGHVVFVVDDLEKPVYEILMAALIAADAAGLRSVSVPALRTGIVKDRAGPERQKLEEVARAATEFCARARNVSHIRFVIHRDRQLADTLRSAIDKSALAAVKVQLGDITAVPCEGLITGINSQGMWGGGVDRAIAEVAGGQYHRLAQILIGKTDGETLVAAAQHPHSGGFKNVVFVVDDLRLPLYDVLSAGLAAADEAGLRSVSIPAMRMGVLMDMGGPPEQKIADMARAVRDFQARARSVFHINFVIYGDPVTSQALQREAWDVVTPRPPLTAPHTPTRERVAAFDNLRTFIIVLLVVHHSVLAYVTYGQFDRLHYLRSTAPIVDLPGWIGFDVIAAFNDVFFMSLMFLISGLFLWPSLTRKGSRLFLRDRLLRLGLPFAVTVTFLMPLAHYPSFRMTGEDPGYLVYWRDCIRFGPWPVGPLWFVALLLVFDGVAALVFWAVPGYACALRERAPGIVSRPLLFLLTLVVVSAAAYFPMQALFGWTWLGVGPIRAPANRLLHYAVYFLAGVAVGACGVERSAFAVGGPLASRWRAWAAVALVAFAIFVLIIRHWPPPIGPYGRSFVTTCAAISFAFLAVFLRFANRRFALVENLSANAYGIYLIHYPMSVWLQYGLMGTSLPSIAKGLIVLPSVLALSWGSVAALRRVPAIKKAI